jgi:hypothetical protein
MQELIKSIDSHIINSDSYDEKVPFLDSLADLIKNYFELQDSTSSREFLFDENNTKDIRRFISVCIIRILGISGDKHLKKSMFLVSKLFLGAIPELCKSIDLNSKTETYQVESIVVDFISRREKEFKENLAYDGGASLINNFQRSYRQYFNNNTNKLILSPFLEEIITKQKLDKIFLEITEYFSAVSERKYEYYQKVKGDLNDFIIEAHDVGSFYALNYVRDPFQNILNAIVKDFENSPLNSPAILTIHKSEKKYPFYKNAKNDISLYLIKDGLGYAFKTSIKIIDFVASDIKFDKKEVYIGDVKSLSTTVIFEYQILESCDSILMEIELNWTAIDGSNNSQKEVIELIGQQRSVNWDYVKGLQPYDLEPVDNENELIGRENILSRLKLMAVDKIGSSYIYGQRRVGKTSIVKTLLNSISGSNLLVIYIEAGDWNDAQNPFKSMDTLGKKICKKVQSANVKFKSVPLPKFTGSFSNITEFLDEVNEIDDNFRVLIILDEFDRISRELFERGDIGKSFLLTVRSISNRSQFGFILVGGEKMEFILSQWQEFNKFKPVRVDYFSKEEDWKDFTQLIKKPVADVLEISDKAIEFIYNKTSGNPYFTKIICIELYNLMMSNRDIHVTDKEALTASIIARNSTNIGATDFSHFWEDGIKGRVEKEEETSIKRRKILIIISSIIKNEKLPTKSNIIDNALEYDLDKVEVDRYLKEFEQRKILYFNGTYYAFYVNFFEEWLLDGGIDKIISSFEEEERLYLNKKQDEELSVKFQEINDVTKHWKMFKGKLVTANDVRNWLDQFEDVYDQRLVFKILQNLKFYTEFEVREKLEVLFKLVRRQINASGKSKTLFEGKRKREDILVSYLDDSPAKGGSFYTKIFVDTNNIYKDNSCVPNLIDKRIKEIRNLNCLLIVDDFLGSGSTMINNITKYRDELLVTKEKGLELIFGFITGFQEARDRVEKHLQDLGITASIIIIDPLDDSNMCFSNSSAIYKTSIERNKAQSICHRKGVALDKKQPLGYNDLQTAIVFPVNCPNNSLPILWKMTEEWTPLFERN